MPNLIERFQELEEEQKRRKKEEEETKKRELERVFNEKTIVLNRELIDKLEPLASILKELKIEEILEEIHGIKTDLSFEIEVRATFLTGEGGYWLTKERKFSSVSNISSTEMIPPWPSGDLLKVKSLKLSELFCEVEVRWNSYHYNYDDYGYNYIRIKPEYSKEGRMLKISDERGVNILNEEQLKSEQVVQNAIILAVLNPHTYQCYPSEQY